MSRFTLAARGPFSLAAAARFLEGFTPAGYTGAQEGPREVFHAGALAPDALEGRLDAAPPGDDAPARPGRRPLISRGSLR